MSQQPNASASGEAAASLWAAMSAASVDSPPEADAASIASDEPPVLRAVDGAVLRADNPKTMDNWRLKFMQRVGVAEGARGGGPRDEPLAVSPDDPSVERPDSDGDTVAVRTAAPPRTSDSIRAGYIRKLEASKASMPQLSRPKRAQVVTIFDWDDTLLCTTHLEMVQRQYGAIPVQVREQLASLERVVLSLLENAVKNGKAFIITNASEGWVQHSSSMCMPGLTDALSQVDIISARQGFEASFPGDSHAWKMHAFLQVSNKLQMEAVTNLISVGDSHIEMDAVHLLGRSFAHALVKTVKLWERPTPYELQKQLEVVAEKLPDIYRSGTTLNIWLERETTQGQPPQQ